MKGLCIAGILISFLGLSVTMSGHAVTDGDTIISISSCSSGATPSSLC